MDITFPDGSKLVSLTDDFVREAIVIESILCGRVELARELAVYTTGIFDDTLMAATANSNPECPDAYIRIMLLEMLSRSIQDTINSLKEEHDG